MCKVAETRIKRSWLHLNLRKLILPVAVFGVSQVMSHYRDLGYFSGIPEWCYDAALVLAFIGLVYWAWTQEDVRKACHWVYNRSPKMLLLILIVIGAALGSVVGVFGYWTIKRQDQRKITESQARAELKQTPTPTLAAENRPSPLNPSPSLSSIPSTPTPLQTPTPVPATSSTPIARTDNTENDPQIKGAFEEVYFDLKPTPAIGGMIANIVMRVRVANEGAPTIIEKFKLTLQVFDKSYQTEPLNCANFDLRVHRDLGAGRTEEISQEFIDLRDSYRTQIKRQFPKEGWLCFVTGQIPEMNLYDGYIQQQMQLKLDVIDGADQVHPIIGKGPFQRPGTLKRKD